MNNNLETPQPETINRNDLTDRIWQWAQENITPEEKTELLRKYACVGWLKSPEQTVHITPYNAVPMGEHTNLSFKDIDGQIHHIPVSLYREAVDKDEFDNRQTTISMELDTRRLIKTKDNEIPFASDQLKIPIPTLARLLTIWELIATNRHDKLPMKASKSDSQAIRWSKPKGYNHPLQRIATNLEQTVESFAQALKQNTNFNLQLNLKPNPFRKF